MSLFAWIGVGAVAIIAVLVAIAIWHYPTDGSF